jgi:coenzyme F420-reducing hydrogenase beta subunit
MLEQLPSSTVMLRCSTCGECMEFRAEESLETEDAYDDFVQDCFETMEEEHGVCLRVSVEGVPASPGFFEALRDGRIR